MKLIRKNMKIFEITESGKITARLINFRTEAELFTARLVMDEKIHKEVFSNYLDKLAELLKRTFPDKTIVLNIGRVDKEINGPHFEVIKRVQMELEIDKFGLYPENEKVEALTFEDIVENIDKIYDAFSPVDKKAFGIKMRDQLLRMFEDLMINEKFGHWLPELSIKIGTPLKGFVTCAKMDGPSTNGAFLIADLLVFEKFRRQGIATSLMREVLRRGKTKGFSRAILSVAVKNPAMHLYERLGFTITDWSCFMVVDN